MTDVPAVEPVHNIHNPRGQCPQTEPKDI